MKMRFLRTSLFGMLAFLLSVGMLHAQGTVSGKVVDEETGEGLAGAAVVIPSAGKGALTDFNGDFKFSVKAGTYTLRITYVGFATIEQEIVVADGQKTNLGELKATPDAIGIEGVELLASMAVDRKTPVAVSTIGIDQIETRLSNQEFPELLRSTPSVYVTRSGGGYGDARINVRGFDQRNTAVLINGIPVNDMENGWVYWSNWAGLSDVTRTMQIQRGLGASKLAINSVGGTLNLITKTTDMEAGGTVGFAVGNDGYMKGSFSASTGRLDGGWAVTVAGSRTVGNGWADATWIDAWSYFGSVAKDFGAKHQLVFTAVGAPQRHGQRSFRDNLNTYVPEDTTQNYADMLAGSTTGDFDERIQGDGFKYSGVGNIRYNSDWGLRNGQVFNIRENFYHKPQFALNHYWTESKKFNLKTSAYYSLGRGGGTGDRGRIGGLGTWGYRDANGLIRVDDIEAWNQGTDNINDFPAQGHHQDPTYGYVATENTGLIKRASMNEHNWFGMLSTANIAVNENINVIAGVDLRSYTGLHYRRVENLMGNDYWLESRDVNNAGIMVDADGDSAISSRETGTLINQEGNPTEQEDKVNYDNDGVVGWQGAFAQVEYSKDNLTAFVAGSGSNTSYKRIDRFNYTPDQFESETFNFIGYNAKAGANYNINENHNVYFNGGIYSRAPIFDVVFPVFTNEANPDPLNERVAAIELGYGLRTKMVSANVNLYRTSWMDKSFFRSYLDANGNPFNANINGLDALHQGIEIDVVAKPVNGLNLQAMFSMGDWTWSKNVDAIITDDDNQPVDTLTVFSDGLKVGDAAQTTASFNADYTFGFGLRIWAQYAYYANLYANFDPTTRTAPEDQGVQAWALPNYGLMDAGISYRFSVSRFDVTIHANMNNVLDRLYIAEANDNPGATELYNLRGFFGIGRSWSAGLKVRFK